VGQCYNYRVTGYEIVEMKTGNSDNERKEKTGDGQT
jgi:hypothetical protein